MTRENSFGKSKEQDNHPVAFNIRPIDPELPKSTPSPEKKDGK